MNVNPHLHGRTFVARVKLDVLPEPAPRVVPRGRLRRAIRHVGRTVHMAPGACAYYLFYVPVDTELVISRLHVRPVEQEHGRSTSGVVRIV